MKNKSVIIILSVILIFGFILRIYKLDNQSYWADEGYTVNATMSIQEKGTTILDSGKYYHCPLYCYPASFFGILMGSNPFAYRLPAVLAGLAIIFIVYLTGKEFFNQKIALLASFFTSFSYWQTAWSRQARHYTLLTALAWLAILFLYKYRKTKDNKYLYYFLLFSFLAIMTNKLSFLLFFILIILLGYKNIIKLTKNKLFLTIFGLFVLFTLILPNFNLPYFGVSFRYISYSYTLPYYLNFLLKNYWLAVIFSIYFIFSSKNKQVKYFLLTPLIVYLLCLSFLTNIVHYRYLFFLLPALYITAAAGIMEATKTICYNNKKIEFIFIFFIILLFLFTDQGLFIPRENFQLECGANATCTPQPNFKDAYNFIKPKIKTDDIIISSHPIFNKIYLNSVGYSIDYYHTHLIPSAKNKYINNDPYTGAPIISNLDQLKNVINNNNGFLIITIDNTAKAKANAPIPFKLTDETSRYLNSDLNLIFQDQTGYSNISVYQF